MVTPVIFSPNLPRDIRVDFHLMVKLLLTPAAQVQMRCIHAQSVFSFSETASQRKHSLLLVKHLPVPTEFQQCTNWNSGTRLQECITAFGVVLLNLKEFIMCSSYVVL